MKEPRTWLSSDTSKTMEAYGVFSPKLLLALVKIRYSIPDGVNMSDPGLMMHYMFPQLGAQTLTREDKRKAREYEKVIDAIKRLAPTRQDEIISLLRRDIDIKPSKGNRIIEVYSLVRKYLKKLTPTQAMEITSMLLEDIGMLPSIKTNSKDPTARRKAHAARIRKYVKPKVAKS